MKNKLKFIATLMLASVVVLSLNSCKKKDEAAEVVPLGKATISGKLTANLDYTISGEENVAGVTVLVRINTYDLVTSPNEDANYPDKIYSAVTDANGNYSIDIEVGSQEVYARVVFPDFTFNAITGGDPATERTVYYGGSNYHDLYQGGSTVSDYNYND